MKNCSPTNQRTIGPKWCYQEKYCCSTRKDLSPFTTTERMGNPYKGSMTTRAPSGDGGERADADAIAIQCIYKSTNNSSWPDYSSQYRTKREHKSIHKEQYCCSTRQDLPPICTTITMRERYERTSSTRQRGKEDQYNTTQLGWRSDVMVLLWWFAAVMMAARSSRWKFGLCGQRVYNSTRSGM